VKSRYRYLPFGRLSGDMSKGIWQAAVAGVSRPALRWLCAWQAGRRAAGDEGVGVGRLLDSSGGVNCIGPGTVEQRCRNVNCMMTRFDSTGSAGPWADVWFVRAMASC